MCIAIDYHLNLGNNSKQLRMPGVDARLRDCSTRLSDGASCSERVRPPVDPHVDPSHQPPARDIAANTGRSRSDVTEEELRVIEPPGEPKFLEKMGKSDEES